MNTTVRPNGGGGYKSSLYAGLKRLMTLAAFAAAASTALPARAVSIGNDITLTGDMTYTSVVTFNRDCTINLNGHKLTINSGSASAIIGSNALGTITDGVGGNFVPAEYEKLEYIASTGTQYIDTGYTHNANTVVDIKAAYTGSSKTPQCSVFGASPRVLLDSKTTGLGMYVQNGKFYKNVGSQRTAAATTSTITQNTVYDYHLAKASGAANTATPSGGSAISLGSGNGTGGNSLVDYLFAMNENGSVKYKFIGKVYSCTIKEGDTVKKNFVPARRKSDGKAGMYETILGEFKESKSGSFTAGSVVESSSSSEREPGVLEIIVENGKTQPASGFKLSGMLKLVKKGGGTLDWKPTAVHDYKGGTEIQEGVFKVNTDAAGTAAAGVFGVGGETVSVGASGTLDLGGNSANLANYVFGVAKGGKIINSGADTATAIKVSGVFSPVATAGDFVVAPQNGAVIDFLLCDSFPVVSPSFSFVSGRTYPLNIEPRTAALSALARSTDATGKSNGYLLGWDAKPANVKFELQNGTDDRYRLESNGNGLLLKYVFGLGIILK